MRSKLLLSFGLNGLIALGVSIPSSSITNISKRTFGPGDNKGGCACPLGGDDCVIKPASLDVDPNKPGSAICKGSKTSYVCGGYYNGPNCNICNQAYPFNGGPHPEMIDCDGDKWCSSDSGKTFHICGPKETPFHPTIHMEVVVGGTTFDVGTYDISKFGDDIHKTCSPTGCDGGTDTTISFKNKDNSGHLTDTDAKLTIKGNANDDQGMVDAMVKVVATVLDKSKQCDPKVPVTQCSAKRETPFIAHNCGATTFAKCEVVNYVQVTAVSLLFLI